MGEGVFPVPLHAEEVRRADVGDAGVGKLAHDVLGIVLADVVTDEDLKVVRLLETSKERVSDGVPAIARGDDDGEGGAHVKLGSQWLEAGIN
jgi:hypothetical protein